MPNAERKLRVRLKPAEVADEIANRAEEVQAKHAPKPELLPGTQHPVLTEIATDLVAIFKMSADVYKQLGDEIDQAREVIGALLTAMEDVRDELAEEDEGDDDD